MVCTASVPWNKNREECLEGPAADSILGGVLFLQMLNGTWFRHCYGQILVARKMSQTKQDMREVAVIIPPTDLMGFIIASSMT